MNLGWSKELTLFDSRLVNVSFNLRTYLSILVLDFISVWSNSTIFMIPFFNSFSRDSSEYVAIAYYPSYKFTVARF